MVIEFIIIAPTVVSVAVRCGGLRGCDCGGGSLFFTSKGTDQRKKKKHCSQKRKKTRGVYHFRRGGCLDTSLLRKWKAKVPTQEGGS